LPIPLALALLNEQGRELLVDTLLLETNEANFSFDLPAGKEPPRLSLLRGFSAPVELQCDYTNAELAALMAVDRDSFSRWEAGQKLALRAIAAILADPDGSRPNPALELYSEACGRLLANHWPADQADGIAELLLPPDEIHIGNQHQEIDPAAIHRARNHLRRTLAQRWQKEFAKAYQEYAVSGPYRPEPGALAYRRLRHIALGYLCRLGTDGPAAALAQELYATADNLTARLAALAVLLELAPAGAWEEIPELADFHRRGENSALLRDRWFALQAAADRPDTLERVSALLQHPEFIRTNPNRVRALLGTLTLGNPAGFHHPDGIGYRLMGQEIKTLDRINPQVAARLAGVLSRWPAYAPPYRKAMRAELERVAAGGLSRDLREIIDKSLAAGGKGV
jgi:aminopeptidase N